MTHPGQPPRAPRRRTDPPPADAHLADLRRRDLRRGYVLAHPLVFVLAANCAVLGIGYLAVPGTFAATPIARILPGSLEVIWASTLTFAGLLVVAGILSLRASVEAGGLYLLASLTAGIAYATVDVSGPPGLVAWTFFASLTVGFFARALILMRTIKAVHTP